MKPMKTREMMEPMEMKSYENPKFEDAWNHPDANNKKGWREAIKKEFSDMKSRKVWQKVKKNIIPHNKRLIGNKRVFKKKKDGRYRARLCALGYSQKPLTFPVQW
jgi:galactose-1-phosphate uridylyltransferase